MKLLAIETSCDDTSVALLTMDAYVSAHVDVLFHQTSSQTELHTQFGGVFPAMAKREHKKNIIPLLEKALAMIPKKGEELREVPGSVFEPLCSHEEEIVEPLRDLLLKTPIPDIDAICVTTGPGLEMTLWVGINTAKALSLAWNIPLIPINHMEGHLVSALLEGDNSRYNLKTILFPALALLVSGAHTELVLVKEIGSYEVLGSTRDDAAGEAFDKVARLLGLPYPGGPEISRLAALHAEDPKVSIPPFPRPMLQSHDYDFSFSGLKTAVRYFLSEREVTEELKQAVAYEFQNAVVDVLVNKTQSALDEFGISALVVGGGVAQNAHLQSKLKELATERKTELLLPIKEVTNDNALMIALAGYFKHIKNPNLVYTLDEIRANGNLSL
jgi:N6-L-threonylcarbamoyladenine synthase